MPYLSSKWGAFVSLLLVELKYTVLISREQVNQILDRSGGLMDTPKNAETTLLSYCGWPEYRLHGNNTAAVVRDPEKISILQWHNAANL